MLQIFASFVETAQIATVGSPTSNKAKCSCARRTRNAVRAKNWRGADKEVGFERTRPRWPDHGSRRAISVYCNANSQSREEVSESSRELWRLRPDPTPFSRLQEAWKADQFRSVYNNNDQPA